MIKNSKNFIANKLNRQITSPLIRIINRTDYPNIDECITRQEAMSLADEYETDLIEIAYNAKENSSICKLMDKDKFIYQEKKKEKEKKNNQKKTELKEIKLSVDIAQNDINTKFNHAQKFLTGGDNVKISLQLKGRQAHLQNAKDKALKLVLEFAESLTEFGKMVNMPVWTNNKLVMQINSKK